jgi:hypothetical protein
LFLPTECETLGGDGLDIEGRGDGRAGRQIEPFVERVESMNVRDDPRCLCVTEWSEGICIRTTQVECPLHGEYKDVEGAEPLVGAIRVPDLDGSPSEGLVMVVRRQRRDGPLQETRFDENTVELARMQGCLDELRARLDRAEDDLRAAYETLKVQDGALSVAELLLAEGEGLRARYETATGRHLRVA